MRCKWTSKLLPEIARVQTGKWDANHAVSDGKYRFYTCAYKHLRCDSKRFSGECMILPGNGANVGEVFYYKGEFDAYQRTYVIDEITIYPKFLYYHLMAYWRNRNLNKQFGSATNFLKIGNFNNYEVKFPSIDEQKLIVSMLDEAFAGIDTAIANTEKNLTNARELFESYLNALFHKAGDGWVHSTLGDVCKFQGGSQPPKSEFSSECKEGYIRLIQIRDYKSDKYIVYIPKEKAKRFCSKTDVMIGRYGPPLFQILRGIEGAYNVALMKAIPDENILCKDFLYYFLKNGDILQYINNASSRAAGQSGLNKATIEPYPIAYPSLEEQANIVTSLDGLYEDVQRLAAIYEEKLDALKELKQSILQKAFSGELTAEDDQFKEEAVA